MKWHKFAEEKPTKDGQYLVQYGGWHPNIKIYELATWYSDTQNFTYWDGYNDCEAIIKDCRYWCEIEEPNE